MTSRLQQSPFRHAGTAGRSPTPMRPITEAGSGGRSASGRRYWPCVPEWFVHRPAIGVTRSGPRRPWLGGTLGSRPWPEYDRFRDISRRRGEVEGTAPIARSPPCQEHSVSVAMRWLPRGWRVRGIAQSKRRFCARALVRVRECLGGRSLPPIPGRWRAMRRGGRAARR